jgi:arylformamidase
LGPIRDTDLNIALKLSDEEIAQLSPLRLPASEKPFSIAYGSAEVPALVEDSRQLHRRRAAAHAPGWLMPIAGANHFTVLNALHNPNGEILAAILALAGRVK